MATRRRSGRMEYVEEILSRADFSRETDLKQRLFAQIMAGKAPATRDISLDELLQKNAAKTQASERDEYRERVKEGAEKRREAARTQAMSKGNSLDNGVLNNDRAITPMR